MRSNNDADPFQEFFDLERLIWKAKKLQRLVIPQLDRTLSLPSGGVAFTNDISEHCYEEFEWMLDSHV